MPVCVLTDGVFQQSAQHVLTLWRSLHEHLHDGSQQLQLHLRRGLIRHIVHQLLQHIGSVGQTLYYTVEMAEGEDRTTPVIYCVGDIVKPLSHSKIIS